MSTLESILSGEREPAPASEVTTPVAQPETTTEQPQGQQDEPSSEAEPQPDETGKVPLAALHAERNKVKRYTEQVAEFQSKLEQQNAQWEQRFSQIIGAIQQPKPAQAEPAAAPDIWEDPNSFVQHQAAQLVSPLQKQMLAMARQVAEIQFQPDAVKAAEEAFNRAAAKGEIDPETHRRINSSPNPFAAAVQWHQHTSTMSEIGSDPAAYKAKLAEEIRAQVLAEIQGGQAPAGTQQQPAQAMPSNFATARNVGARAGPAWAGQTPLADIFKR